MKTVKKKKIRLKKRLTQFMIFVWFLPLECLFLVTYFSFQVAYRERTDRMIGEGVSSAAILTAVRIDEAIRLMEKPSYEKEWETGLNQYRKGEISKASFYVQIKNTLKKSFYRDSRFESYAFYLDESGLKMPLFFASRTGENMGDYLGRIQPTVQPVIESDSNYVEVHVIDGKIYLIRNLYTISDYERYGSLVVSLNKDELTEGYPMQIPDNVIIGLNGTEELFYVGEADQNDEAVRLYGKLFEAFSPDARGRMIGMREGQYKGYLYQKKYDDYSLGCYYIVHDAMVSTSRQNWIVVVVSLLLFLMTLYGIRFLRHNIEQPLDRMVEGSKKMEKGEFGSRVESEAMPNEEFAYLASSFNDMSQQVKHLFDTVYSEQIARKDAQIAALQAQINPHFLNNTLEMMNWQARMNNDIEICKMIESLSIVLDHSINRNNQKTIYLSEELRCADAYLYIMSMRFGQRLKVEREIDGELLRENVPQLILQPLIENAIMHGIETVRQGTIWLCVHHDDRYTYVDVINTGKELTTQDQEVIDRILAGTYEPGTAERGRHTSIGIRNVNRRIKLVYGEEYGLTIRSMEDGRTRSRIMIPYADCTV
ncbi:MAG: histidine kinase [Clostridiales bacterium]|nr:histidine kinase [Clostridiales bacterium]